MSNVFDLTALGRWYGKAMAVPNLPEYAGPLMENWASKISVADVATFEVIRVD